MGSGVGNGCVVLMLTALLLLGLTMKDVLSAVEKGALFNWTSIN